LQGNPSSSYFFFDLEYSNIILLILSGQSGIYERGLPSYLNFFKKK
jgi:hypothetical protein